MEVQKSKLNLPSNKLLVTAVVVFVGIYVLWYALLAVMFSADSMREKTLSALSQALGVEVTAIEQQQFSLLPYPKLILNSVQVRNHPKSRYPNMLAAPNVKVVPSLGSLFGELVVTATFYNPKLEFETFADKTHSWQSDRSAAKGTDKIALLQQINFVDASVHYSNPSVNRDITIDKADFTMQFSSAEDYTANGTFKLARDIFAFEADFDASGQRELSINNRSSTYQLKGQWDNEANKFSGTQTLESVDIGQLFEVFLVAGEQPPALVEDTGQHVPATFSSAVKLSGKRLTLTDIKLQGQFAEGTGQSIALLGASPEVSAQVDLQKLDFSKLMARNVFTEFVSKTAASSEIDGFRINLPGNKKSSLPQGVKVTLSLKADHAQFSGAPISKLQLAAKLNDDGVIDVAQYSGKWGDDGQFLLKGKVEGSYDGLAFKGTGDVAGTNLSTVYTTAIDGIQLPDDLKRFRGRGNLYINPTVMRLSELLLRIEKMQVAGTLVRQEVSGSSSHKYEGAFRIQNINLDELQRAQTSWKSNENADEFDKKSFFDNLNRLVTRSGDNRFNIKLSFVDAVLNEKPLDTADLRFMLNRQFVAMEEMAIPYQESLIRGKARMSFPATGKPKIDADIAFDSFDSEKLFGESYAEKPSMWRDENGLWTRREFNILWLADTDVKLKFKAAKFSHAGYELSGIDTDIEIENGELNVPKFHATIWGGKLNIYGKMLIAKLPTFTANLTLDGFQFDKLQETTDLFANLYGRASIRGSLSTTGVNPHSAVQNMKGTMSIAGSQLKVKGFNLENMVRAANAVRTVQDIEKLVKYANRGGETQITTLQGNMNIDGGFIRTPAMRIATPVGNGGIKGQVNLMDWDVNLGVSIYLTALQRSNPPDIRLVFVGPMSEVGRSLDTQSLESFITKQAAERLLVNP